MADILTARSRFSARCLPPRIPLDEAMPAFTPVPERYDFPAEEARTSAFWKSADIFRRSLEDRADAPTFVFYEGPPTANGRPHPGHVLTRVIKDLFPRYKTMRGFRVPRKAGWDTHGLPVEIEVEKDLGIQGKEGIVEYGVEQFVQRCIESVFVYTKEWEELTERIGFWVDLSDAYVTFHQSYVESVWWSLAKLFEEGLLYQDRKVVWWWPQGGTTLSQAEVGEGYREVDDPSVFIRFRDAEDADLSYLAWTTTPWTLPSNVALAVGTEAMYVEVTLPTADGTERIVVAKDLVARLFGGKKKGKKKAKKEADGSEPVEPLSVSEPFPGEQLVGRRYRQLLPFRDAEGGKAFEILAADFVSVDGTQETGSGTGIVHVAPAFGEDDYRVARQAGFGYLQLVDEAGRMTEDCGEGIAGLFCKDADKPILRRLEQDGALFRREIYRHDYPFCPRAKDDPLIQLARPAWFVETSRFVSGLLSNNERVRWVPENIGTGRFGKFLEDNVDWALSRERFWGTPLPIWRCEKTGHTEAVASYADLLGKPGLTGLEHWEEAKAANPELSEHLKVHKPYIDAVTWTSPKDPSARMRRVSEVIDCWYDAGAMPFAQWGYPHAEGSEKQFAEAFPADFISEAIDQTRGWFYALIAESTLLHQEREGPHPYKTCIVLGHVCDRNGIKMSKRLKNYLSPNEAMDAHGADALRWYFLSQGHPWTNARFSLERVGETKKDFLIRLQNVFSFFSIYANIDGFDPTSGNDRASDVDPSSLSMADTYPAIAERTLMDRWVMSELQLTIESVTRSLDSYDILSSTRALFGFVDNLSNWYVRRSRARFWGAGLTPDKLQAHWTLYECLVTLSRLIAPFVPFFAEKLWSTLVREPFGESQAESVHLTDWPEAERALVDEGLSRRMSIVLDLVALGRAARVEAKLRVRQPLREAIVVATDAGEADDLGDLLSLAEEELNVKRIRFTDEADKYVEYHLHPNFKLLGPRVGRLIQKLKAALATADASQLRGELESTGKCTIDVEGESIELSPEEIEVRLTPRDGYVARSSSDRVLVLDTQVDESLRHEWFAREVVACVNSLRGERGLAYEARIELTISCDEVFRSALEPHAARIRKETLAENLSFRSDLVEGEGKDGAAGDHSFAVDFELLG